MMASGLFGASAKQAITPRVKGAIVSRPSRSANAFREHGVLRRRCPSCSCYRLGITGKRWAIGIYADFPSETSWSEDLSSLFCCSDSLFANPVETYNDDLAYASANLAAAADNSNTSGSDYGQKSKNVVRLLKDIGCSDVVANAGYTEKPCKESSIGVAIGNKKICVNGQDYRLFVIGARGGGYEQEWATNLRVGDGGSTGGDHQGFQEARDAAIAFIMEYIEEHAREGERVKVWASGYCRGGIVMNMACAWLDKWIYERNDKSVSHGGSYNKEHSVYGANYSSDEMRFVDTVSFDPSSYIDPSVTFSISDVYCYPVNPRKERTRKHGRIGV